MSSLADFVNEQRSKNSRTPFSVANIGNKVTNSFHGFFRVDSAEDRETLTESPSANGQLPSSRNRRLGGWFGGFSFASESQVCGLSRIQRIFLFFMFLMGALICFGTALILLPVLIVQTRKFAALNTLGSVFFIMSFGFLLGPLPYLQLLFSSQRRVVIALYFLTVLFTLYTSLWLQNTVLTIISSSMQAVSLFWYLMTFVPGGESGLKLMTRVSSSVCSLGGRSPLSSSQSSSKLVLPI